MDWRNLKAYVVEKKSYTVFGKTPVTCFAYARHFSCAGQVGTRMSFQFSCGGKTLAFASYMPVKNGTKILAN